jgi:HD superfamily phosphohydrolase
MLIYDSIHGYIKLCQLASSIIDTPVFQRLRNIHQTGVLYLVFPTATHNRFEHSIGTYYLAKKMIENIATKQPELNITKDIINLVSIAGLCHDLGHMLFSHLFDDSFLTNLSNYEELKQSKNIIHENRSIFLLNYIVDKYNINLNKDQLKIISDLINTKSAEYSKWKPKYQIGKWIFQIISNPKNSIDVDKFDYLVRDTHATGLKLGFNYNRIIDDAKVIDNNICYSSQCSYDIYHMFFIRYSLHRQIYNHKSVKAIEILIVKLLNEFEKEYKISEYIFDPEKIIELVDFFIWQPKNEKIKEIINEIQQRKIPKLVYQDISINKCELKELPFDPSTYKIIEFKVGYINGPSNPLNNINFYSLKNGNIVLKNKVSDFSLLINQKYQEHFLRVYCTDLTLVDKFKEYFLNI